MLWQNSLGHDAVKYNSVSRFNTQGFFCRGNALLESAGGAVVTVTQTEDAENFISPQATTILRRRDGFSQVVTHTTPAS